MALITDFEYTTKGRDKVQESVKATYRVFRDSHGDPYLQINTYGSPHRQRPDTTSQTIQLGPEGLEQLRGLLKKI